MNSSHPEALLAFSKKLSLLLLLRVTVQMMTVWFFIWGVLVLAMKIGGLQETQWLAMGLLGFVPIALVAGLRERRRQPAFEKIRANYDRMNACGGVMMAQETADMGAWFAHLPAASIPKFRWRNGRMLLLLCVASLFAATALLLPERLTHLLGRHPLEISQILDQLKAEVQTLQQEKILPDQKSNELLKQLAQLQQDSSGYDPNKTWEALDHIKQSNSDLAKQAEEEAEKKTESLTEAETLAKAMEQAADDGMEQATASQAAQDLASLLNAAKLEDGILNGKIPPELLQNLNGLNKEQMEQLAKALEMNKGALSMTMSNLASLKMIDPAALAKLQAAGHMPNFSALSDYLSQCKGGNCNSEILFSWLHKNKRGRGGPGGGGPEAPMDWDNNTSEDNQKFQAHALPPSAHLSDSQMVGMSKAAPQLSANDISEQHGALDDASASGGSAHAQVILPEHRQAVQNFFKRDEK
ncbi:MAG TPA: hypothetical protein VH251_05515 [Verrucomicrobiae bacterium]|jgi:cell division septum initiation protein DivIVA|nr:hypothetical protein [Verrucomicrobiae bacterium]